MENNKKNCMSCKSLKADMKRKDKVAHEIIEQKAEMVFALAWVREHLRHQKYKKARRVVDQALRSSWLKT